MIDDLLRLLQQSLDLQRDLLHLYRPKPRLPHRLALRMIKRRRRDLLSALLRLMRRIPR